MRRMGWSVALNCKTISLPKKHGENRGSRRWRPLEALHLSFRKVPTCDNPLSCTSLTWVWYDIVYLWSTCIWCPLVSASFWKGIHLLWLRCKYVMAYLFPSAWRNCAIKYQLFIVEGFSICHDTAGTFLTLNWVRPVRCGICFSMPLICCSTVSYAFCSNMYFPLQMHNAGFGVSQKSHIGNHWNMLGLEGVEPAPCLHSLLW